MVQRTWDGNRLLWRALAASVGLHLLIALFLPVWTMQVSAGLQPVEAVSFAHILRIRIQRPAAQSLPAAVQRTQRRAPAISFARTKAELTALHGKPVARPTAQAGPKGILAAAPRLVAAQNAPLYARPDAKAGVSTKQAPPAPPPQPQATLASRAAAGSGSSDTGGAMPLDAYQPPTLDPAVLAQLQKRVAVHVTLIVDVGEDGRTKEVQFQPPLDAQTETAIRTLLADANWDAAICGGGVSCAGKAEIKL
ncbi:MAG TPA: hypothetical protein VIO32_10665 [Candidatus Baltobacteraceae bacterium]